MSIIIGLSELPIDSILDHVGFLEKQKKEQLTLNKLLTLIDIGREVWKASKRA